MPLLRRRKVPAQNWRNESGLQGKARDLASLGWPEVLLPPWDVPSQELVVGNIYQKRIERELRKEFVVVSQEKQEQIQQLIFRPARSYLGIPGWDWCREGMATLGHKLISGQVSLEAATLLHCLSCGRSLLKTLHVGHGWATSGDSKNTKTFGDPTAIEVIK